MIKALVFDLGGVILPFDHTQIASKLYERSASKERVEPREIFAFLFDPEKGFVNLYEEGKMSSEAFFEAIKKKFNLDLSFDEFKEIWNPIFWEDKEVEEILYALKARNYFLFLLSNTNELHFSYIKEKYPIVHILDKWILSYEIGAKKPKRAIYEAIFKDVSFSSEEVLYIDDIPQYVLAARNLGIQAVLYTDAKKLKETFLEKGINLG